jgi:transcription elongation factor GreA
MNNPERQNVPKSNIMTAHTKSVLEEALNQARIELSQAQLSIGEAAGSESDWHDNAAFDYANMEFDLKSANLARLTNKLRDVEIIPPRQQTDKIDIGNTVVIKFEDEPENETFTILGPDDSGKKQGWLSHLSPLGKSLIGKVVGETAEYSLGKEKKQIVRIVNILPGNFE